MRYGDTQVGAPEVIYKDTKANIEALTMVKGAIAYATDTNEFGTYDGATWTWGQGQSGDATYGLAGVPVPMDGTTGTVWQVPTSVFASGSLAYFYNGNIQNKGTQYEELIFVSGTFHLLFIPASDAYHMVIYGVPMAAQTYTSTGTDGTYDLVDSDGELLVDSDGVQLVDSEG